MSKYGQNFKDIKYELSHNYKLCKLNDKKTYEELRQTLCEYILKSYAYEKALDKACDIIVDLNECTNVHAEEYYSCPFREECEEGDVCLSTTEKWKEYLLRGTKDE